MLKPNKRLEGYDQYHVGQDQSRMNSEQTQSRLGSDNFKKSLRQIQNHTTDENIEEEYIKGLQDEIRLLEYELKLLKDKDIEQQASLSQIDHFFNDGVPLNENILAIKNQYVLVKKEFEARLLV